MGGGSFMSHSGTGSEAVWSPGQQFMLLPPDYALNFITVDGTAEFRVKPEEIRVVLAVTNEAENAAKCQEVNAARVQNVLKAWEGLKIPEEHIVQDFINLLPRYEWQMVERDGEKIRIQKHQGYRMQTNLHVLVTTEKEAMAAINLAIQQGVAEIVTFDYWSSQLDEQKVKARAAALELAKKKAATLLAVIAEPPPVINLQESTAVFFPQQLYRTYENVLEESRDNNGWNNRPTIKAYRPKMTFYQGLQSRSDLAPTHAAMHPEIMVVSTVRLYYESPARKSGGEKKDGTK
jgi:uncharacterized protein YggE